MARPPEDDCLGFGYGYMNVNGQWIVTTHLTRCCFLPGQLACLRADLAGMAAAIWVTAAY